MKVSVSIPEEDVAFLDAYAAEQGVGSRSAAVQQAVALLRASSLEAAYELALDEWPQRPMPAVMSLGLDEADGSEDSGGHEAPQAVPAPEASADAPR